MKEVDELGAGFAVDTLNAWERDYVSATVHRIPSELNKFMVAQDPGMMPSIKTKIISFNQTSVPCVSDIRLKLAEQEAGSDSIGAVTKICQLLDLETLQ